MSERSEVNRKIPVIRPFRVQRGAKQVARTPC